MTIMSTRKPEHSLNIGLKAGGRIYNSKKHQQVFKLSISCLKSSFPLIIFSDSKPIVDIFHINLSKYSNTTEKIKYLIN